jgi:hypothetical protein
VDKAEHVALLGVVGDTSSRVEGRVLKVPETGVEEALVVVHAGLDDSLDSGSAVLDNSVGLGSVEDEGSVGELLVVGSNDETVVVAAHPAGVVRGFTGSERVAHVEAKVGERFDEVLLAGPGSAGDRVGVEGALGEGRGSGVEVGEVEAVHCDGGWGGSKEDGEEEKRVEVVGAVGEVV